MREWLDCKKTNEEAGAVIQVRKEGKEGGKLNQAMAIGIKDTDRFNRHEGESIKPRF